MKYWTKSWNTMYGCTKTRAGCENCWALVMARRMSANSKFRDKNKHDIDIVNSKGDWTGDIVYRYDRVNTPYHWRKPQIVAVNWMGDMFHYNVAPGLWYRLYEVMSATPQHVYLILTKRYGTLTMKDCLKPVNNVYIGVTISNQRDAETALPCLLWIHNLGWKTWVSYEPALETVDWRPFGFIDGLVCGGESGSKAREMSLVCPANAFIFCRDNGIPFTFKQWGSNTNDKVTNISYAWINKYEFPKERTL
ncbi:MAG: DUF5131 family protein [Bacteroidota bacterium]